MLRYTLRQLEYLSMVAELGSIAKASERMNVSSPSISAAISQLEAEFGLQLFVRHHAKGLSLTPAGRKFMQQARRILKEAGNLTVVASKLSLEVRGPLSIGCLLTFAQVVFPSLRKAYEENHPEVQVRQIELHQGQIIDQLRQSEIDIALTYDLDVPADLHFFPLIELPPYAVMCDTHPLAGNAEVSVEDLKKHPMVLLDLPHSSDYFLSFFNRTQNAVKIAERTKDMAVMRSLVANGYGYSIANVRFLTDQSPDGKPLKFIPIGGQVRALNMGLMMPKGADKSSLMKSFINHCREMIEAGKVPGLGSQVWTESSNFNKP